VTRPRIHLIGPAGSCRKFMAQLGAPDATRFMQLVQSHVGPAFAVTGDEEVINGEENDYAGGRRDDRRRADDIQAALGDPDVAAVVTIRGGAWLTRILHRINFNVLSARTSPVAVFGFSEMTTVINIAGRYRMARAVYDMGPAFLSYGISRRLSAGQSDSRADTATDSAIRDRVAQEFAAFWGDVVSMLEGRGTARETLARRVSGEIPREADVTVVGGNLVVLCSLLGTRYQTTVQPSGRWLLLEEINEKPERIDRWLANLTLAGFWDECTGLLLGDFHRDQEDLAGAVQALLDFHLPEYRNIPILKSETIGHTWPMSPLLLHTPIRLVQVEVDTWSLCWPADTIRVV